MMNRFLDFLTAGAGGGTVALLVHTLTGTWDSWRRKRQAVRQAEFVSRSRARDPRRARTASTTPTDPRSPAVVHRAYVQE